MENVFFLVSDYLQLGDRIRMERASSSFLISDEEAIFLSGKSGFSCKGRKDMMTKMRGKRCCECGKKGRWTGVSNVCTSCIRDPRGYHLLLSRNEISMLTGASIHSVRKCLCNVHPKRKTSTGAHLYGAYPSLKA